MKTPKRVVIHHEASLSESAFFRSPPQHFYSDPTDVLYIWDREKECYVMVGTNLFSVGMEIDEHGEHRTTPPSDQSGQGTQ